MLSSDRITLDKNLTREQLIQSHFEANQLIEILKKKNSTYRAEITHNENSLRVYRAEIETIFHIWYFEKIKMKFSKQATLGIEMIDKLRHFLCEIFGKSMRKLNKEFGEKEWKMERIWKIYTNLIKEEGDENLTKIENILFERKQN